MASLFFCHLSTQTVIRPYGDSRGLERRLEEMRPNPFGSPLGMRMVLDAIVVSYALWLLTGSALIILKGLFQQVGWI